MAYVRETDSENPNTQVLLDGSGMDALAQRLFGLQAEITFHLDGGDVTIPSTAIRNGADLIVAISPIQDRRLEGQEFSPSAASCTVTLDNVDGYFNEDNASGPLYGEDLFSRQITISGYPKVNDTVYSSDSITLFIGFMDPPKYDGDFCSIECFSKLSHILSTGAMVKPGIAESSGSPTMRKLIVGEITPDLEPQPASTNVGNGKVELLPLDLERAFRSVRQTLTITFTSETEFSSVLSNDYHGTQLSGTLEPMIWHHDVDHSRPDATDPTKTVYDETDTISFDWRWERGMRVFDLYAGHGVFDTTDYTIGMTGRFFGKGNSRLLPGQIRQLNTVNIYRLGRMQGADVPSSTATDNPEILEGLDPADDIAAFGSGSPVYVPNPPDSTTTYLKLIPAGDTSKTGMSRRNAARDSLEEGVHYLLDRGRGRVIRLGDDLPAGEHWMISFQCGGPEYYTDDDQVGIKFTQGTIPFQPGDSFTVSLKYQAVYGEYRTYLAHKISATDTTIEVYHPTILQNGNSIRIDDEIIHISSQTTETDATYQDLPNEAPFNHWLYRRGGAHPRPYDWEWKRTTFTVVRGYTSTVAAAHSQDSLVVNITRTANYEYPSEQILDLLLDTDHGAGETDDYHGFALSPDIHEASFAAVLARHQALGLKLRHAFTSIDGEVTLLEAIQAILGPSCCFLVDRRDGSIEMGMYDFRHDLDTLPQIDDQDYVSQSIVQDREMLANELEITYGPLGKTLLIEREASLTALKVRIRKEVDWPGIESEELAKLMGQIFLARVGLPHHVIQSQESLRTLGEEVGDTRKLSTGTRRLNWTDKRVLINSETIDLGNGMIQRENRRNNIVDLNVGTWGSHQSGTATRTWLLASINDSDETIDADCYGAEYVGCPEKTDYDAGSRAQQTVTITDGTNTEQFTADYYVSAAGDSPQTLRLNRDLALDNYAFAPVASVELAYGVDGLRELVKLTTSGDLVANDLIHVGYADYVEMMRVDSTSGYYARLQRGIHPYGVTTAEMGTLDAALGADYAEITFDITRTGTYPEARIGDFLKIHGTADEIVRVLVSSSDSLTVDRGVFGTCPQAFSLGDSLTFYRRSLRDGDTFYKYPTISVITQPETRAETTGDDLRVAMWGDDSIYNREQSNQWGF